MNKEKTITILRWVAVPIAALLCAVLACLITVLYSWLDRSVVSEPTLLTILFEYVVKNLFLGAGFVYGGSYTAPSHTKTVSTILATVFVCISVFYILFNYLFQGETSYYADFIIAPIGAVCTSVYIHRSLKDELSEEKK